MINFKIKVWWPLKRWVFWAGRRLRYAWVDPQPPRCPTCNRFLFAVHDGEEINGYCDDQQYDGCGEVVTGGRAFYDLLAVAGYIEVRPEWWEPTGSDPYRRVIHV